MHVMIGPGAAPIRPESPTSVRPIARQIGQWRLPGTRRARAVTLAFCWAHVRRRFYEIAAAGPAPIASEAIQRLAKLYESDIRGRSADEWRSRARRKAGPSSTSSNPGCAPSLP